jgi:AcrR family transcriptional regulator
LPQEAKSRPYHHGDLRRALLDAAQGRLESAGLEAVSIRACARDTGVSGAAPIHHFGSLKGLFTALAARGFEQLIERLDAELKARGDASESSVLVGAYVAFAVSAPRLFDLMWRDDVLDAEDAPLNTARRQALVRLQAHSEPDSQGSRIAAIRNWSLAHGLATLLLHGRIEKALGSAEYGLATTDEFVALAYTEHFLMPPSQ